MEMESYQHGVPSWIDHSSPDPAKASEFYRALFGWDIMEGGPEYGGYNLATKGGRNVAGIGPQMGGPGPSYWATYVNVDSADNVMEKVRAHGGTVIVEQIYSIPGLGSLLINSITTRDYSIIQLATLILAVFVIVANLLTDLAYAFFDPRVELHS